MSRLLMPYHKISFPLSLVFSGLVLPLLPGEDEIRVHYKGPHARLHMTPFVVTNMYWSDDTEYKLRAPNIIGQQ